MIKANLLTSLVAFGANGEEARFCKVAEIIIVEECAKASPILSFHFS